MKLKDILIENPADPTDELRSSKLYHGTPSKHAAEQIKQHGLKYDDAVIANKYKDEPNFAPIKDGVYLTKELGNAIRYSFMAHGANSYEASIKSEPYGYVFEFSGEDLSTVTPDEDELGHFVVSMVNHKNLKPALSAIVARIPKELRRKIEFSPDSFETVALAGKWLVNAGMSKRVVQYLMKNKDNVVNYGTMKPRAVFIIKKPDDQFLRDKHGTFNSFDGYIKWGKEHSKRVEL